VKLVAALLRVARVTAGLVESNGSLPPGLWLTSPARWLPRTGISAGTLRSVIDYGLPLPFTILRAPVCSNGTVYTPTGFRELQLSSVQFISCVLNKHQQKVRTDVTCTCVTVQRSWLIIKKQRGHNKRLVSLHRLTRINKTKSSAEQNSCYNLSLHSTVWLTQLRTVWNLFHTILSLGSHAVTDFYRAMLCIRGTSPVSVCLSACLSVRPSVRHKSEFY